MNKKSIKKYVAGAAGVGAGILGGKGGSGLSGLMGGMEGLDIGGMASKLGGTIGMMINANKKDPNPGRPYMKGTNMIKYQAGVEDITPITPKMASIRMPQEAPMSPKPSKVPVEKQSRRERKAENKRLEAMAKAPIIYNESSFVGPMNQEPKKSTPILDNLIKRSMSSQVFKETMSPYISFKDMTPVQQKQYRAGIASGREFTVEGIGKYAAVSKEEKAKSAKMASKATSAKPLVKMRGEDSWTPQQWKEFSDNRKKETSLVNKEEAYRKNPDLFWKDVQALRKSTMGKNFDRGKTSNNVIESPKKFSMNDIMSKKKELSELRSKVPGFGPFRRSEDAKTVEKIDYINSKLYKLSQQEAAYERRKKRGEAGKQAEMEAQERAKEFNRLTKDLKI